MMIHVKKPCRVSMVTFGGFQNWTAKVGDTFPVNADLGSFIREQNDSYCIVKSGLNYYVFEAQAVNIVPA